MSDTPKPSTDPYKGVRDFYPEDMAAERWMFSVMRRAAESFGYVEYGASILEPSELYAAKTSEEIVNEQTYTFVDRGGRSVTLRPEMTPSLARMVAARRRELGFPLRWYSIPNVFRYERPQRGRLREHWQLNCDLFGIPGIEAEVEIVSLAHRIMLDFGAKESDFEIRVSDRRALDTLYESIKLPVEKRAAVTRLIDRRAKEDGDIGERLREITGDDTAARTIVAYLDEATPDGELADLASRLASRGIRNARIDPGIVRGFDYYTGIVFEVFDTDPKNNRSLFGGGRYDNLLTVFGGDPVPAVGFGMGDVTLRDFLETRGLIPAYRSSTDLYMCVGDDTALSYANEVAEALRAEGLNVAVDATGRSIGDQKKAATRQKVPFIAYIRERDRSAGAIPVEDAATGAEETLSVQKLAERLHAARA